MGPFVEDRVMTSQHLLILGILLATMGLFLWGRWRHDMVAMAALLACVLTGLVPAQAAFSGFGHPAVITVACVLVLSRALQESGAVDALTQRVLPAKVGPIGAIAALTGLAAVLSGFMNNVGALALLMPVAIQMAGRLDLPSGRMLMPLAFGSILGGMTTLIGTPPNLIVSGFRAAHGADTFRMFDFTPIGFTVAAVGVGFVALIGWRLVPARERPGVEGFDIGAYLTEARVPENAKADGLRWREIQSILDECDAQAIGLVRNDVRMSAPRWGWIVRSGDILVLEAEAEALPNALSSLGLVLEEAEDLKPTADGESGDVNQSDGALPGFLAGNRDAAVGSSHTSAEKTDGADAAVRPSEEEVVLAEFAILPQSDLVGRSASDMLLRTRYGINLLAVSRQGRRAMGRLRTLRLAAGDVLLMQGAAEALHGFAAYVGCVPLAERTLRIPDKRAALTASGIMALAVGGAAFGLLPAAIAFAGGVLASMALRTVSLRSVYEAVDWPVVVLLGALMPVAGAMESTGAADLIARFLLQGIAQGDAIVSLALILIVTMMLSDVMNNAATAAVMCPIAIGTAGQLGVSVDPFLMAVAVGASCAFLTPIGHQNNTLILGPGGFRFGDYWRLGLPLEILIVAIGMPMLLWV
jgi:di/tricarboxylate transporter